MVGEPQTPSQGCSKHHKVCSNRACSPCSRKSSSEWPTEATQETMKAENCQGPHFSRMLWNPLKYWLYLPFRFVFHLSFPPLLGRGWKLEGWERWGAVVGEGERVGVGTQWHVCGVRTTNCVLPSPGRSRDWTQFIRFLGKCLYPLSHYAGSM